MTATTPAALPADLTAGLRRLKLAAMRQLAPEFLLTAKTQRWAPEEVLRALVEAEITARDASNERARLKAASFPVLKTLEEFDLAASSDGRWMAGGVLFWYDSRREPAPNTLASAYKQGRKVSAEVSGRGRPNENKIHGRDLRGGGGGSSCDGRRC